MNDSKQENQVRPASGNDEAGPEKPLNSFEALSEALKAARCVALCVHVNPDGDTVGSALALRLALLSLGKQVDIFSRDKVPDTLRTLPGVGLFRQSEEVSADETWDVLMTVDVSEARRSPPFLELKARACHTAQLDHHITNPLFCETNWVEDAPASALLVWRLLKRLGVCPDREIASCLYAGVSTDTGNFSYGSMTAEAFEMMGELMAAGLPLAELSTLLFRERPIAQARLMGKALDTLTLLPGGEATVMTLRQADFIACGALEEHADTIVNLGLDLVGVRMAALLRETGNGKVKVSLRGRDGLKVDGIAGELGGGGHEQAAGITLEGVTLDEARETLVSRMLKEIGDDREKCRSERG